MKHHYVFLGAIAALGSFWLLTRKPPQADAIANASDPNGQAFLTLVGADLRRGIVKPAYLTDTFEG